MSKMASSSNLRQESVWKDKHLNIMIIIIIIMIIIIIITTIIINNLFKVGVQL